MKNKVIISKTPLRVSFVGGGTDMPYFYKKYSGATISCAIDRYIYVTVKFHNNYLEKYRLNYSETENTNSLNKIKNLRIKGVIKMLKINKPLYINTFADIPANSGLGSSSSFTVGLIKALSELNNKKLSKKQIAEMAFKIESNITHNSIGKQDHYIASFGGINFIKYDKKEVKIFPINVSKKKLNLFFKRMILIWTGKNRSAVDVLNDQKSNIKKNIYYLREINKYTLEFKKEILKKNLNIKKLFKIIGQTWEIKKKLSNLITNKNIEQLFTKLKKNGAQIGKLLGAGNGGFILIHANSKVRKKFMNNFVKKKSFDFNIEKNGSVIL